MMTTTMGRRGFTLMEVMVVLLIVGILAAIALPSYSRYIRTTARAEAQSQMLVIAGDLERWRSKNLSYLGFTPSGGFSATTGSIATAANETIYLPRGSTSTNYKYQLAVLDGTTRLSLTSTTLTAGQRWLIVASPNPGNSIMSLASRLVLSSQGVRCLTDIAVADGTMKSNLTTGGVSDPALCVTPSKPW